MAIPEGYDYLHPGFPHVRDVLGSPVGVNTPPTVIEEPGSVSPSAKLQGHYSILISKTLNFISPTSPPTVEQDVRF